MDDQSNRDRNGGGKQLALRDGAQKKQLSDPEEKAMMRKLRRTIRVDCRCLR